MTDWTTLDVERLADALEQIYISRGFYYGTPSFAKIAAHEDAMELLGLVADKLDVERLARAIDRVWPNPYSAVMAAQVAGEYELVE